MASYKVLAIFVFLLITITIVIQSAPIEKIQEPVQSSSVNTKQAIDQSLLKSVDSEKSSSDVTTSSTTTVSQSPLPTPKITHEKKKRYIDDDLFDDALDSDSEEDVLFNTNHGLHTQIKETSANIHDNADKPVDTDDSKIFSDILMTPNELTNVIRRRRNVKLNDQANQRRKRALSPYDFYDTDSFYDPYADLIEQQQQQYDRPIRSFAPIYWYPSAYQRSIRAALAPSFYESYGLPRLYSTTIDDDDEIEENPDLVYGGDEDDEEEDYESNRYPILLQSSNNPFDNFELQQQYNTDDLPIDEDLYDDNDENFNDDDDNNEEQYRSFYPQERPDHLSIF